MRILDHYTSAAYCTDFLAYVYKAKQSYDTFNRKPAKLSSGDNQIFQIRKLFHSRTVA